MMAGRDTLTMLVSSADINVPIMTTPSTSQAYFSSAGLRVPSGSTAKAGAALIIHAP